MQLALPIFRELQGIQMRMQLQLSKSKANAQSTEQKNARKNQMKIDWRLKWNCTMFAIKCWRRKIYIAQSRVWLFIVVVVAVDAATTPRPELPELRCWNDEDKNAIKQQKCPVCGIRQWHMFVFVFLLCASVGVCVCVCHVCKCTRARAATMKATITIAATETTIMVPRNNVFSTLGIPFRMLIYIYIYGILIT